MVSRSGSRGLSHLKKQLPDQTWVFQGEPIRVRAVCDRETAAFRDDLVGPIFDQPVVIGGKKRQNITLLTQNSIL